MMDIKSNDNSSEISSNQLKELYFTGNWFADCGIMGFINLMEEVYGWDLNKLNTEINKDSEKCFYVYFPFAYLFYHSKIRSSFKDIKEINNEIKKIKNKLNDFRNKKSLSENDESKIKEHEDKIKDCNSKLNIIHETLSKEKNNFSLNLINLSLKIFNDYENFFLNFKTEIEELIENFDLKLPVDHRNFFIYNPKQGLFYSFLYLFFLLKQDHEVINLIKSFSVKKDNDFLNIVTFCEDNELNIDDFINNSIEQVKNVDKINKENKSKIISNLSVKFSLGEDAKKKLESEKSNGLWKIVKNENKLYIFKNKLKPYGADELFTLAQLKILEDNVEPRPFLNFIGFCKELNINLSTFIEFIKDNIFITKNNFLKLLKDKFSINDDNIKYFDTNFYSDIKKAFKDDDGYELFPDSTVNPFLFSPKQFSNMGYTLPLATNDIESGLKLKIPYYLLVLSFYRSFQFIPIIGKSSLLYTNNLDVCYSLNKKIETKKNKLKSNETIFTITWSSIIDELIESKSSFALENMYIIEYETINNQKLINVMFMDIDKFRANILIDDIIRDALNNRIQITTGTTPDYKWLIEELIKNKPLYPHILKHVILRINNKTNSKFKKSLLYALATDVRLIDSVKHDNNCNLFAPFFDIEFGDLAHQIKKDYKRMYSASRNVSETFSKDVSQELISSVRQNDAFAFMNILLKNCVQNETNKNFKYLNDYIFYNILKNKTTWHLYALAIIIGLT